MKRGENGQGGRGRERKATMREDALFGLHLPGASIPTFAWSVRGSFPPLRESRGTPRCTEVAPKRPAALETLKRKRAQARPAPVSCDTELGSRPASSRCWNARQDRRRGKRRIAHKLLSRGWSSQLASK